jgi:hypothetical protein
MRRSSTSSSGGAAATVRVRIEDEYLVIVARKRG